MREPAAVAQQRDPRGPRRGGGGGKKRKKSRTLDSRGGAGGDAEVDALESLREIARATRQLLDASGEESLDVFSLRGLANAPPEKRQRFRPLSRHPRHDRAS